MNAGKQAQAVKIFRGKGWPVCRKVRIRKPLDIGRVRERLKRAVLKTARAERSSWVRIPPLPKNLTYKMRVSVFYKADSEDGWDISSEYPTPSEDLLLAGA